MTTIGDCLAAPQRSLRSAGTPADGDAIAGAVHALAQARMPRTDLIVHVERLRAVNDVTLNAPHVERNCLLALDIIEGLLPSAALDVAFGTELPSDMPEGAQLLSRVTDGSLPGRPLSVLRAFQLGRQYGRAEGRGLTSTQLEAILRSEGLSLVSTQLEALLRADAADATDDGTDDTGEEASAR